ncbi:MAG: hypothetical protein GY854_29725, partial [Deltaproteobacteria bacterium]|nr:hypothetical protein [Deltaproteobacteria bacterium]
MRFKRIRSDCRLEHVKCVPCDYAIMFLLAALVSGGCKNADMGGDAGGVTAVQQALSIPSNMQLEIGVVEGVTNTTWSLVELENSYSSLVVVATPAYTEVSAPLVTRVRNAGPDSFELKVDRFDGQTVAASSVRIHYIAVEEGVYTAAADGLTMEAVRYNSGVTDRKGSWSGESRAYSNTYTSPVVIGQVMSYNDTDPSVFWSRGSHQKYPVSASYLRVGKHVGEDQDNTRADETVGYIVVEAGSGTFGGLAYQAAIGSDIVKGITNSPPWSYTLDAPGPTSVAAVSQTGMDGGNGSWAVLYGNDATTGSNLLLTVDEDQMKDSERSHVTEQVAYLIFNQCPDAAAEGQPCDDGVCSSTGECVACNTDDDCSDGDACDGQEVCNSVNECDPGTPPDCDDGSACTTDSCDPMSGCQNDPVVCDDEDACTTDSCDPASGCQTSPVVCDDGNACTADSCDPATGCEVTPIVCDDSNACTIDSCDTVLGCQAAPLDCNDGNECTADTCDPLTGCANTPLIAGTACSAGMCDGTGACVQCLVDGDCDDGDACNGLETCSANVCVAGTPLTCDDGNECTVDSCDAVLGCVNDATPGATCETWGTCNDLAQCVYLGWCTPGQSRPGIHDGDFVVDDLDTAGDLAQLEDKWCITGQLAIQDTTLTDLSALSGLQKVRGTLDLRRNNSLVDLSGLTNLQEINTLYVSGNDSLSSLAGMPLLKSAVSLKLYVNPNLQDLSGLSAAIPYLWNVEITNNGSLTDLSGLEIFDRIAGYLTVSHNASLQSLIGLNNIEEVGSQVAFYNNDLMTDLAGLDSLSTIGSSFYILYHDSLVSLQGAPNLTTVGSLTIRDNPPLSVCQITELEIQVSTACTDCTGNLACDDADACNGLETCNAGQCETGTPLVCDDSDVCNGDETCDPASGCVSGTALDCDDGSLCTNDSCDSTLGCQNTVITCDDGDACTNDSCNPATGCQTAPVDCDDGSACTVDSCDTVLGCQTAPVDCDDDNVCNGTETCNPATGCQPGTPLVCDDGNVCNGNEWCQSTQGCLNGSPLNCDDGNFCTNDFCDNATGCYTELTDPGIPCVGGFCDENGDCIQQIKTIFVDVDATGTNDGTSWSDAYTDLQSALSISYEEDEIWVAAGSYKPTVDADQEAHFNLVSEVALYGGFDPSVSVLDWEQRDPEAHATVLTGDIGTAGVASDNSFHVVYCDNCDGAILDGFTITDGYADGFAQDDREGGGLWMNAYSDTLTVSNSLFAANSSEYRGGAVYVEGGTLTLTDCEFDANESSRGAALYSYAGVVNVANNLIQNSTTDKSGAFELSASAFSISDTDFINNQSLAIAATEGGG